MSEFKIGDRVRVVAEHLKNRGAGGMVIDFDKVAYRVQFEDHRADWKSWYFDSELEAADAPSAGMVAEGGTSDDTKFPDVPSDYLDSFHYEAAMLWAFVAKHNQPNDPDWLHMRNVEELYEALKAENATLSTQSNDLFHIHNGFMVDLCAALGIPYEESGTLNVRAAVKALQAKLDVATAALEEITATTPEWEKDKPRDVLRLEMTATPNTQRVARQALARLKGEAHDS